MASLQAEIDHLMAFYSTNDPRKAIRIAYAKQAITREEFDVYSDYLTFYA